MVLRVKNEPNYSYLEQIKDIVENSDTVTGDSVKDEEM